MKEQPAETFYDIHNAITIAKDAIGIESIKRSIEDRLKGIGMYIEQEKDNKLIVKSEDCNYRTEVDLGLIRSSIINAITECFDNNDRLINEKLKDNGYPNDYLYNIKYNIVHAYFVVPNTVSYEIVL